MEKDEINSSNNENKNGSNDESNVKIDYQILTSNIVITEVNDLNEDNNSKVESNKSETDTTSTTTPTTSDYLVEEPFDYIFEPGHYPPRSPGSPSNQSINSASSKNHSDSETTNNEKESSKIYANRSSRLISEKDGILEYEYISHCQYDPNDNDPSKTNRELNEFYYKHHHLNAIIRGISLSKCPNIGFGFNLAKHSFGNEDIVYVNEILADSPAEFCLQLGDILIELDEMNPCEKFPNLEDMNKYLNEKDNIHMMAIHESKYVKLKSENEDLLKNYNTNCEDIVIVTWNRSLEANTR